MTAEQLAEIRERHQRASAVEQAGDAAIRVAAKACVRSVDIERLAADVFCPLASAWDQDRMALLQHISQLESQLAEARGDAEHAELAYTGLLLRLNKASTLLQNLVTALERVHADPKYESVWTLHQLHNGPYTGPTYTKELAEAKAALAGGESEPRNPSGFAYDGTGPG